MPITNPKVHVADMIPKKSLKDMINKYRIVEIIAGVGAGKNTWAEELAKPRYAGYKNILYITSRAAVKESIKRVVGGKKYIDLDAVAKSWEGRKGQLIFTVTNSGLRRFMENTDLSQEPLQIWRQLDYIVIDEYHSLATDSAFTDDPFYVERFLRLAHRGNENLCIIAMTGTPSPVDWLFTPEVRKKLWFKSYNWLNVCRNTATDEVEFIGYEESKDLLKKYLEDDDKVIYFTKSVARIQRMIDDLTVKKSILDKVQIAVGFSDELDKDKKKDGTVKDKGKSSKQRLIEYLGEDLIKTNRDDIRTDLINSEKLPPHIQLFITTSQNKEGVSIHNKDIHIMFVESTTRDEIIQMAGRVREGLTKLYIINSPVMESKSDAYYYEYKNKYSLDKLNETLMEMNADIEEARSKDDYHLRGYEEARDRYIKEIPKIYEYIMYDKYLENKFVIYEGKYHNAKIQQLEYFWIQHCAEKKEEKYGELTNWEWSFPYTEDEKGDTLFITGQDYMETFWFPGSHVKYTRGKPKSEHDKIKLEAAAKEARQYIENNGLLWTHIPEASIPGLLDEINTIYAKDTTKSFKAIGNAIKRSGLHAVRRNTKGDEGIIIEDITIPDEEREKKLKEAKAARKAELKTARLAKATAAVKKPKKGKTVVKAKDSKGSKPVEKKPTKKKRKS